MRKKGTSLTCLSEQSWFVKEGGVSHAVSCNGPEGRETTSCCGAYKTKK